MHVSFVFTLLLCVLYVVTQETAPTGPFNMYCDPSLCTRGKRHVACEKFPSVRNSQISSARSYFNWHVYLRRIIRNPAATRLNLSWIWPTMWISYSRCTTNHVSAWPWVATWHYHVPPVWWWCSGARNSPRWPATMRACASPSTTIAATRPTSSVPARTLSWVQAARRVARPTRSCSPVSPTAVQHDASGGAGLAGENVSPVADNRRAHLVVRGDRQQQQSDDHNGCPALSLLAEEAHTEAVSGQANLALQPCEFPLLFLSPPLPP